MLISKFPDKVSSCTSDYYYFKCPVGEHESSQWKILSLTRHGKTKTVCKKCNSFAQWCIDNNQTNILNLWDYDKLKKEVAKEENFDVLTIWENDYRKNKKEVLENCIKFLNL